MRIASTFSAVLAVLFATHAGSQTYLELSPADRVRLDALVRQQAEEDAKAIAELKDMREKLLRTPPLPAERNPLLGQWKVEARATKSDELADLFDTLANFEQAKCGVMFGEGSVTEFRAKDWASIDSFGNDSLGAIQYRGDSRHVWLIPDKYISTGLMFFSFEFVNDNRVNVLSPTINEDCALNRVAGSIPPAARAPAPIAGAPAPAPSAIQ